MLPADNVTSPDAKSVVDSLDANARAIVASLLVSPEVTVVEFGTGWYLRGNVGFSAINVDPGFNRAGVGTSQDLGQAYSFEIGGGYQVNNYLRVDGTIEHMINLDFIHALILKYRLEKR